MLSIQQKYSVAVNLPHASRACCCWRKKASRYAWKWGDIGKTFGSHHKDGVLYAYGAGFKRGFNAPNAEVFDVVPTLLRAMKLPFPYTFDGHVLEDLFVEDKQAEQGMVAAGKNADGGLARRKLKKSVPIG